MTAQTIIDKANRHIAKDSSLVLFLGLSLYYPTELSDDPQITTAATDGQKIMWNEKFLLDLHDRGDVAAVKFVQLHELGHIALGHCGLRGKRMRKNYESSVVAEAVDYATNAFLLSAGVKLTREQPQA